MRDPKRIERMLQQMESAWHTFPDMRLGQLLLNITRAETTTDLWNLEDGQVEEMLDAFIRLKVSPRALRYVRHRWHENRGGRHDDSGHSYRYFEIDPAYNVIRQIEQTGNGMFLGYDSRRSHDEFGGLLSEPLAASLDDFDFIDEAEFNRLWLKRSNV